MLISLIVEIYLPVFFVLDDPTVLFEFSICSEVGFYFLEDFEIKLIFLEDFIVRLGVDRLFKINTYNDFVDLLMISEIL